jgi:hypothetical protein
MVSTSGHSRCGTAQWVRIAGLPGGDINVINVYASTNSLERVALWEELSHVLPRDCRSILVGDFNFVERRTDKSNLCGKLVSDGEKVVFSQLVALLGVEDNFPSTSPVKFSWDNRRRDGVRVLARLDRIYSFQTTTAGSRTVEEYFIKGGSVHSDHLAVWCKLLLTPVSRRQSTYKMSKYYLKDEVVKLNINLIWGSNPNLNFFGRLRKCVKYYKEYCVRKAKERRLSETKLRQQLSDAMVVLQSDPDNINHQNLVNELMDKLQVFEKRTVEGQRIRSRIKWMGVGDSGTKEFYRANKRHSGASRITELEDSRGVLQTDQVRMEEVCREYYCALYTAAPQSLIQEGARTQALACIGDRLSEGMKADLKAPIMMHELEEALKGMKAGKAPGPDGIITEFFKTYWEIIGDDYLIMIIEAVNRSHLPSGVTWGLISLLYKGGDREKLTNWRPITLLNVAYKLYAKVLQLRLQPVLMEIIDFDQSAFLPMRFILDNIMLTHETMEWAEHSNQPLIFLKLDFSKAYDMVDFGFLFGVMHRMGFPTEFVGMTQMLFKDAAASVKVNGAQIATFQIGRGVRLGCPLAPYLFLLVAEVMNAMIKKEVEAGVVKGIRLPFEGRQQVIA